MYRQRKRDLNLKPNRQLDKRSSRGMIYENEELRMRTIAICEDVDRGQSDIKKLRKENDHLKREIWGLRDECEKLEEILKKVCISANIPEFQLESSGPSKKDEGDDSDDDDDEDEEEDNSSYGGGSDKHLKISDSGGKKRKESVTSVQTFDSEVGSCMTQMFGEDPGGAEGGETGFAAEDVGSVIMKPDNVVETTTTVVCHPHPLFSEEPTPSTSFAQQPSWSHPTAGVASNLDEIREETESAISSPQNPSPLQMDPLQGIPEMENMVLPDPSLIMLPQQTRSVEEGCIPPDSLTLGEGRKTPVIQITPASSPASNENGSGTEPQSPIDINAPAPVINTTSDADLVHSAGCVTVVPKTFKVTSEIVVGGENEGAQRGRESEELPRRILKSPPHQISDPLPSEQIVFSDSLHHPQRRSCYYPAGTLGNAQTLPPTTYHRGLGFSPCCCCGIPEASGYQSEPSLNQHGTSSVDEQTSYFSPFQCCRVRASVGVPSMLTPLALRSVWNTVDRNIVIGFYGVSSVGANASGESSEPRVQEIIDELETQFDPTLENIQGIRLIPGRIFVSLKNAALVTTFLSHFKNDLIIKRKNTQQRIRVHFIEGASQKLTTTLVLSGIPQELSDLAVISALNQFGQVVAPLERRNYKGVDISERIAKMHLVVGEAALPDSISVNGYNIRIQMETSTGMVTSAPPPPPHPATSYGFVTPVPSPIVAVPSAPAAAPAPGLKPHKPVTRSSSSAPRLETPAPGTLTCPLPSIEHQKRQSSVCVANIPPDQHPSKILEKQQLAAAPGATQHKVTIATPQCNAGEASSTQSLSTLQANPPPKKPLARLLVSSPGSFTGSPPVGSPTSPGPGGDPASGAKGFYRNFDPRKLSTAQSGAGGSVHAPLTPSSSYSPRSRRKSSVQFANNLRKGGKKEPLPWCGCWGLGCGN